MATAEPLAPGVDRYNSPCSGGLPALPFEQSNMQRMTEAEWFASADSYPMLRPCRRIIREQPRKGHLFAVACCRRIWHLLSDPRSRAAVEIAAQYAEGVASLDQLQAAAVLAKGAHKDAYQARGKMGASGEWAAEFAASLDPWFAASMASNFAHVAAGDGIEPGPERAAQAHLLRCIFGPLPFRAVSLDDTWKAWNDGTVVRLAQAIFDERAFDQLPILADALEDAGCADGDMIQHCRQPGTHVRGCWVLDLLVGKE